MDNNTRPKELEKMEKELSRGLQFANLLGSVLQEKNTENTVLLQALVDLLISKGLVHYHELEEHKRSVAESILKSQADFPHVQLVETPDKYDPGKELMIDCAERREICQGVCCRLWFSLSVQDLTEGLVHWNYGMPYGIAQDEQGYCVHFDHNAKCCGIYEHRPLICRTYDCATDTRIWQDHANKVLSAEALAALSGGQPPASISAEDSPDRK